MAKNFEDILTSMLERLDENPDQDVNALVKDECEKMGVSEEGKALLSETNEYLDGFAEKMAALQTVYRFAIMKLQFPKTAPSPASIREPLHWT